MVAASHIQYATTNNTKKHESRENIPPISYLSCLSRAILSRVHSRPSTADLSPLLQDVGVIGRSMGWPETLGWLGRLGSIGETTGNRQFCSAKKVVTIKMPIVASRFWCVARAVFDRHNAFSDCHKGTFRLSQTTDFTRFLQICCLNCGTYHNLTSDRPLSKKHKFG